MTISYTQEVANMGAFGVFWKLLFRWKGSVYKMIWRDLLIFTVLYAILALVYRLSLERNQQLEFEKVIIYCKTYADKIPLTFMLGFFVSLVVQRWWGQFEMLPWPNTLAILTSNYIKGADEKARMFRRTVVRYVNVSFVLTIRMVSPAITKHRFPTLSKLVDEGFLLKSELPLIEDAMKDTNGGAYWVPLVWAINLVETARKEEYIQTDIAEKTLVMEICSFRGKCGGLLSYDWISIPLVYTQVVTIAVYSYLYATVIGDQFIIQKHNPDPKLDIFVPLLTYLQLIFYMGWMKVAESLVNPFGKDDEDFDVDSLITKNLKNSYIIVDKMMDSHPELSKDLQWDETFYNSPEDMQELNSSKTKGKRLSKDMEKEESEHLLLEMEAGKPNP